MIAIKPRHIGAALALATVLHLAQQIIAGLVAAHFGVTS